MKKHPLILCAGITSLLLSACNPVKVPEAILPVPEAKQVEWQKMETYAFVHFGLNTFNDREWGYGDSDPKTFNPAKLDCEQWVKTFVESGMKGVILTAKHHDGFCLWPTQLTEYCIRNTPYKNGQGDIVRELSDACKKYGIKFALRVFRAVIIIIPGNVISTPFQLIRIISETTTEIKDTPLQQIVPQKITNWNRQFRASNSRQVRMVDFL